MSALSIVLCPAHLMSLRVRLWISQVTQHGDSPYDKAGVSDVVWRPLITHVNIALSWSGCCPASLESDLSILMTTYSEFASSKISLFRPSSDAPRQDTRSRGCERHHVLGKTAAGLDVVFDGTLWPQEGWGQGSCKLPCYQGAVFMILSSNGIQRGRHMPFSDRGENII